MGFILILASTPFDRRNETLPDALDQFCVGKRALFLPSLDSFRDLAKLDY